jgi:hypothetical protein
VIYAQAKPPRLHPAKSELNVRLLRSPLSSHGYDCKMVEADEFRLSGELGGAVTKLGVADLAFAVLVVAIAAGWILLAVLL